MNAWAIAQKVTFERQNMNCASSCFFRVLRHNLSVVQTVS